MQKIRICLVILLLTGWGLQGVQAQQTTPAAGGDASGTSGTASYTLGQAVYTTITGTDGTARQGVQQSFDINVKRVTGKSVAAHIRCSAWPNPVTDQLNLSAESNEQIPFAALSYRLYAPDGTLLQKKRISGSESVIHMGQLPQSAYVLQIFFNKNLVTEFTIIKNR